MREVLRLTRHAVVCLAGPRFAVRRPESAYRAPESRPVQRNRTTRARPPGRQFRRQLQSLVGQLSLANRFPSRSANYYTAQASIVNLNYRCGCGRKKGIQALIAAMSGAIPRIYIARFMLWASTCKLISVLTR